jgi:hypothetical protein
MTEPAFKFINYPYKSPFVNHPVLIEYTVQSHNLTLPEMLEHIQSFLQASGYDFTNKYLDIVDAEA